METKLTLIIVLLILSIPIAGISLHSVYSYTDLPTEIAVQGDLIEYEIKILKQINKILKIMQ